MENNVYENDKKKEEDEQKSLRDKDDNMKSFISYMDYRIKWICDRVLKFLGLIDQEHLFYNLINANNRYFEDKLLNFLILDLFEVTDLEKKLIFFYKTYVSEVYQEEVPVWEERKVEKRIKKDKRKKPKKGKVKVNKMDVSSVASRTTTSTHTSSIPESSEEEEEEEDDKKQNGDFPKKKEDLKSASTDSSVIVPPLGEEYKYVLTKKMVEKVRQVPVLHMICGQIDDSRTDLQDITFFYFMRTSDKSVPSFDTYEECLNEITNYVVVGSLDRKFLSSLNRILVNVFKPLVKNQFGALDIHEQTKYIDDEKRKNIDEEAKSMLRRPAPFVTASNIVQDLDANRKADDEETTTSMATLQDQVSKSRNLKSSLKEFDGKSEQFISESSKSVHSKKIKKEAVEQFKRNILDYLNNLIEKTEWTLEHIEGDILLTMPQISELNDPAITDDMLVKNKDIVEQMEEVVMSWQKHIQKIMESYEYKILPDKGPIEVHQYWQICETGLTMLVEQLKMPIVKRILALLEQAVSPVASNFHHFQSELWKHYVKARDTNKFMQTLLRYFKVKVFKTYSRCIQNHSEHVLYY
ncbi:DYH10 protein, partial [Acromyrmex heyeri]